MLEIGEFGIIDLRDALEGQPGSYLRFDTHWSPKGVELSAEAVLGALLNDKELVAGRK